jgi:hypothetical protein
MFLKVKDKNVQGNNFREGVRNIKRERAKVRSMMKNPLQATRACHRHSSDPRPHIADCSDRSAVASFPSVDC